MMMMGGMAAIWLIILIVIAVRAVGPLLASGSPPAAFPPARQRTPEELVRERYARGEIGWPEYQEVLVSLLKERYVRGELELADYEEHVSRLLDEGVQSRDSATAPIPGRTSATRPALVLDEPEQASAKAEGQSIAW